LGFKNEANSEIDSRHLSTPVAFGLPLAKCGKALVRSSADAGVGAML
jgi:hypothetical protein